MPSKMTLQNIAILINEFQQSNLTIKEFCAKKEIAVSTFYEWKNKLKGKASTLNFVPAIVQKCQEERSLPEHKNAPSIVLNINNKFKLELQNSISTVWLSSLIKELS